MSDEIVNNTTETAEEQVKLRGIKSSSELASIIRPQGLHGRRQIFTNERTVTRDNIIQILNDALPTHLQNRADEVYLENYVRGIQPVLERTKQYNDYICNRVVVNMANQIVTFKTAEFAGEPIQYISRGTKEGVPEKIEKLNSLMMSEGKQSKDMDLAYKMFTCGVGYRLVLNEKSSSYATQDVYDEAPFEIYIPDPKNTFVVRVNDVTKRILMGVTYVFLDSTNTSVEYTVYTENATYSLTGSAQRVDTVKSVTTHNFGMVNLVEYPCNSLYMSPIEVVHDLLNAMSDLMSDRMDGIDQFIQAVMVFEGVDITREDFLSLKDLGALKIPPSPDGRSGRVYYLNEQLDQSQTQTLVDDTYQRILQIVGMPSQGDGSTGDSSNNGAVIMKNGWWSAEARSLEAEGMWKEAETQFLKVVLRMCNQANALTGLSVSDVDSKFGRRSYEDLLVKTQSFSTLVSAGCPPIQAFTFSKLGKDPESDALVFSRYQEEQAAELDKLTGANGHGDDHDTDGTDNDVPES